MIDKKEFQKQIFETHGILEKADEYCAYKVPLAWVRQNAFKGSETSALLRKKIQEITWEKADEYKSTNNKKITDNNFIERFCHIPCDTYKKAISGDYTLTRNFLAKFTVGLKLEIEQANELFRMHSGELNLTNDFDYIVYHALKTKDDIDFFIDEVYKYTGITLDRDMA